MKVLPRLQLCERRRVRNARPRGALCRRGVDEGAKLEKSGEDDVEAYKILVKGVDAARRVLFLLLHSIAKAATAAAAAAQRVVHRVAGVPLAEVPAPAVAVRAPPGRPRHSEARARVRHARQ